MRQYTFTSKRAVKDCFMCDLTLLALTYSTSRLVFNLIKSPISSDWLLLAWLPPHLTHSTRSKIWDSSAKKCSSSSGHLRLAPKSRRSL